MEQRMGEEKLTTLNQSNLKPIEIRRMYHAARTHNGFQCVPEPLSERYTRPILGGAENKGSQRSQATPKV